MEKSILVLYGGDDWNDEQPNFADSQIRPYQLWGELCLEQGIRFLRGAIDWFEDGTFTKYWEYTSKGWQKRSEPLLPHVVYDKCRNFAQYTPHNPCYDRVEQKKRIAHRTSVLNYPEFSEIIDNKLAQSLIFSEFLPETRFVPQTTPPPDMRKNAYQVFKQIVGSGGKEVDITSDHPQTTDKELVQEALIPATTPRDVRITFLGENPEYAYIRKAATNSLYTNIHQGAEMEFVSLQEIPHIVSDAKRIIEPLSVLPRYICSIDFLLDENDEILGLLEVNTRPGLQGFESQPKLLDNHLHNLTQYLLKN